jgi:diguanylate cyclase (GGDEF)-like protein
VKRQNGVISGYVATFSDITDKLRQEQALRKLAYHDPLTGLHNRAAFLEMFDRALVHAERHGQRLALLYLDLDRFKKINDTLGHVIGDKVLEESARRLRESVRSEDEVARLGGDEFIIMLEDLVHEDTPARVARKVISLLGQPLLIEHRMLHMTTSIGIAVYPDDGADATSLLKNADAAMYMAKQEGRNGFHYFTQAMAEREEDRFSLEIDLHTALMNEEFLLHYQPKIDLRTGQVIALEGLLRWQHPYRGLLTPSEFLAVAHDGGVMRDITHWVITESCRQLQEWLDAGLEPGRIAINIDAHTLNSTDAYDQIGRTVEVSGISPHRVELQISESGLREKSYDDEFWRLLAEMGFELAIDDFGIGESSLLRLKHLPVTTLKIDKSFISNIGSDEGDRAIIRTVVAMGQSLGVRVSAQGVEQKRQLAFLCQVGCDAVQGHLFSPPRPAQQIPALLLERPFKKILETCQPAPGRDQ